MEQCALRILALGLVGLVSGCASRPQASAPPPAQAVYDRFADLAHEVPGGFAGMWLEGDVLHVNLVDLSKQAEAQAVLKEQLRGRFGPGQGGPPGRVDLDRIVFHQGRFDHGQLTRWYVRILSAIDHQGVLHTGIEAQRNRISVYVKDDPTVERVQRRVLELGIPPEAVAVRRGIATWVVEGTPPPTGRNPAGPGIPFTYQGETPGIELRLDVPERVRSGEPVRLEVGVINTDDKPREIMLTGRRTAFDFVITDANGRVVWTRAGGTGRTNTSGGPRIFQPGEELSFSHVWDQRDGAGNLVPPGTYQVRGWIAAHVAIVTDAIQELRTPFAPPKTLVIVR
jgi:hypothetical protein